MIHSKKWKKVHISCSWYSPVYTCIHGKQDEILKTTDSYYLKMFISASCKFAKAKKVVYCSSVLNFHVKFQVLIWCAHLSKLFQSYKSFFCTCRANFVWDIFTCIYLKVILKKVKTCSVWAISVLKFSVKFAFYNNTFECVSEI